MQTYEQYKESGIEWIGQIPEHWECKRLGNWFEERRKKVSDKDFEPLSVTKNGIVPQLDSAAKSNDGDNRKLVIAGDFVINSRSDRKGSSGLSYLDGSVSLINIVMKPRGIYPKFSEFLLKSNGFIEEFYRNGHGIVADLWTTRYDEMKFIFLAIPPIHEQEAIANFLDEKTAKIDALVQTKEQQIEKLKELRQAKIHQAVTKGLDANAPTKDSGVEWIGEIPAHWEMKRLKHLMRINNGLDYKHVQVDEGYPVIGSGGQFAYASNYLYDGEVLFLGRKGTIDKPLYFIGKFWTVDTMFYCVVNNKGITKYLYYFSTTIPFKYYSTATALPSMTQGDLNNHNIPTPPIKEQEQIVAYLDEVTGKIDEAITQKQEQITKLKEYKQSLINDVVTGKVKVC
ncbi:restriction endonuclease subunit S [Empedobacter sp. ULE_I140]